MITVDRLAFGYRPGEPIVEDLDWTFPAGAATAITGPSGCGKSTLLYLLGLLLTPQAGSIAIDGHDVSHLGDRERSALRAAAIGFVFQDAALDPTRTVLDNVTEGALYAGWSRRAAQRRGVDLMGRFGVELRLHHKPGEVSGGQAQRVALCRALLNRPSIVLADEPTGNLDAESAVTVIDALLEAAQAGVAVVISSHDASVVSRCDRVLAL